MFHDSIRIFDFGHFLVIAVVPNSITRFDETIIMASMNRYARMNDDPVQVVNVRSVLLFGQVGILVSTHKGSEVELLWKLHILPNLPPIMIESQQMDDKSVGGILYGELLLSFLRLLTHLASIFVLTSELFSLAVVVKALHETSLSLRINVKGK